MASLRIDLLDAILGELKQMPAVERRSCPRRHDDRAHNRPGHRIEGVQLVSGSKPDMLSVIRNPMHLVDPRKRAILTNDFGRRPTHTSILITWQWSREQQGRRESRHGRDHPTTSSPATKRLHLARSRQRLERPLNGTLAGSQRKRQGRARPRLTVGQEGKHRLMLSVDRRRQHYYIGRVPRRQYKTPVRGADLGNIPNRRPQPPYFHA